MKVLLSNDKLVKSRINREYNKFQYHLMKLKKEQIINKCGKIHFYECIREYFEYNDAIPDDTYHFLSLQKDIIHSLWELYLKHEQLGFFTWEQVDDLIAFWMNRSYMLPAVRR